MTTDGGVAATSNRDDHLYAQPVRGRDIDLTGRADNHTRAQIVRPDP
jgi:hypothetical protein